MLNQINKAFAELDAEMLERQTAWALERYDALHALNRDDYDTGHREADYFRFNAILHSIAGGKAWYREMMYTNKAMLTEYVAKNVAKMIANRNDRIVKALNKNGVTEIPEFTLLHGSNGFEGAFKVADYWVTINTILAGGYNIQCLHQRTLVKVK